MIATEKIDIYNSEHVFEVTLKKFKTDKDISPINKKHIIKFLEDSAIGKTSSLKKRGKNLGVRSRLKLLFSLKICGKYFCSKDFKKLIIKDMEKFVKDLDNNIIKRSDKYPYSSSSKADIKETMIRILRWTHGEDSQKFIKMTRWIDTSCQTKTVQALLENDIKEILSKCKTIKQKMIVCSLFDGGFRIEEFLNIRNSDVELVDGSAPFYRLKVRTEFSKTKGRNVGMYWSESYDIIKEWINSKDKSFGSEEPFFIGTYDGVRKILNKLGDRVSKKIYPHLFRHSSATYYASKLRNAYQMNVRYGWSHGSDMSQTYIDNAGVDDKEQIKEYEENKLGDLKMQLRKLQEDSKFKDDNFELLKKDNEIIKDGMKQFQKLFANMTLVDKNKQLLEPTPYGLKVVKLQSNE